MRYVLFSRIKLLIPELTTNISYAATRPPPILGIRACDRTAMMALASWVRIWVCWLDGKTSMIRLTVPWAPVVCNVPNTMWPVSAAVMAASIVSRSRNSPTRITSGSIRNDLRMASAKLGTSVPTSRWLIVAFLW